MAAAFFSNVTFHLSGEKNWLVDLIEGIILPYRLLIDYEIDHYESEGREFFFPCFNVFQLGLTAFRMPSYFLQSNFFGGNIHKNRNHIEVPGSERSTVGKNVGERSLRDDQFVEIRHLITQ